MEVARLCVSRGALLSTCRRHASATAKTALYPPIQDLSVKASKARQMDEWCKQIQQLDTVEEKQMKLNMPRYYGWKSIMFNDKEVKYNSMKLAQHCTRTHFKDQAQLPESYSSIELEESLVSDVQSQLEAAISFECSAVQEDGDGSRLIQHINRIVLNNLSERYTHLCDIQIDEDPRHEAFWFVGGISPPENWKKSRAGISWLKDREDENVDRAVQYTGHPLLALRGNTALGPIIDAKQTENLEVANWDYDPKVLGYNTTYRHGTNIPGHWPGDPHPHGLLSFQKPAACDTEGLHVQGILSLYSWLLAQAAHQGFTTYNDVAHPLTAQTIISDGRNFSFYVYQLNTTLLHSENHRSNPKCNVCWGGDPQTLFQGVDTDGNVLDFNVDVLRNLLQLYANAPLKMLPQAPVVASLEDQDRRVWLEERYKYMMSNRPRHRLPYELYHWEKIYKVDHNTKPLDPKRRPFELGKNPWKRAYNEHAPVYIPKALRPNPKHSKFYKTYYP